MRCNGVLKFRVLLARALALGAEALATGHYARRVLGPGGPELHRAEDAARDQSYFLFATTRDQLDFVRFPLGGLDKSATRGHAERLGLPVADKPDSQDICFVPTGRYADLVRKLRPEAAAAGEIVATDGRVLGRHEGVAGYTVGQRRGLGVAAGERLYVVGLDAGARRVVVGPRAAGGCSAAWVADANWLDDEAAEAPVLVQHRYNEPPVPARLERQGGGRARVVFAEPQHGVAPGQACVAYRGSRVLGGGWIERAPLDSAGVGPLPNPPRGGVAQR